jgi:hypothetical protein
MDRQPPKQATFVASAAAWAGRQRWLIACLALLCLLLAGCGGEGPARQLSDIPPPPGIERYEGPAETTLDGVWIAAALARAERPAERSVDYYWKPSELTFEQVRTFYAQQLPADGWQLDKDVELNNVARWTRASAAGQQVLVVAEVGIDEQQGTIVMRALVTE